MPLCPQLALAFFFLILVFFIRIFFLCYSNFFLSVVTYWVVGGPMVSHLINKYSSCVFFIGPDKTWPPPDQRTEIENSRAKAGPCTAADP